MNALSGWILARVNRDWLWSSLLALAVVLVYLPVQHAGFIWDDDTLLTKNPCIVGPLGLKQIWTTSEADVCPFVITTFWFEHALWGLAPAPFHVVTVFLHAGCAILLGLVLRNLRVPGAWLGAALWALHPVQVESVAWIAEMKNTESTLFYLLTILFFLRWLRTAKPDARMGSGGNYGLSLAFAVLAAASKSSTVILPVVLALCVWWKNGRLRQRDVLALLPLALIALAAVAVSMSTQGLQLSTVTGSQESRPWLERIAGAGNAVWFYLEKLAWPHPLITVYPRWNLDGHSVLSYLPLLAVFLVLFRFWWQSDSWSRPWLFAFVYFLVALLPVVGLADNTIFRYGLVFDHFQYLASMGPLALAGAGLARMAEVIPSSRCWLPLGLGAWLLVLLGSQSWRQAGAYESQRTLWSDVLTKDPNSWVAYTALGNAAIESGNLDEAITDFRASILLNPNFPEAYNGLAGALAQTGKTDEAIDCFKKALEISPGFVMVYNNLGNVLIQRGRIDEALLYYRKGLEVYPGYAKAWDNLGNVLIQRVSVDEAITSYKKALAINSQYAVAHADLGRALLQKGRYDDALAELRKASAIDPNLDAPHEGLGEILARRGQIDNAIAEYEKALKLNPRSIVAGQSLGDAFLEKGRLDDAIKAYRNVLELEPLAAGVRNNLGNLLLQKGHAEEALAEYRAALRLEPNDAMTHNNAGAALFQLGRWDDAIAEFQKVVAIDPANDVPHYSLGLLYTKKGQGAQAIAEYEKALAINPNNTQARDKLAAALPHKKPGR